MELDEFLASIKMPTKVNGEESEVTLADLRKGYQLESDYTKKNEAFLNERKEWEAQRNEVKTKLTDELQKAGQAFGFAQQQITHEFNAINWNELQQSDPTKYLTKRQEFGERQASLDTAINQASANAQQVLEAQQAEQSEADQKYLNEQNDLLLAKLPSWSDPKVKQAEAGKVAEFLTSRGFTPDEISDIRDHRVILMATQAMTAQKVATDTDVALRKVKKAPKLVKPNARQTVNPNTQRLNKLRTTLKKSGSVDDVANLLIARG